MRDPCPQKSLIDTTARRGPRAGCGRPALKIRPALGNCWGGFRFPGCPMIDSIGRWPGLHYECIPPIHLIEVDHHLH